MKTAKLGPIEAKAKTATLARAALDAHAAISLDALAAGPLFVVAPAGSEHVGAMVWPTEQLTTDARGVDHACWAISFVSRENWSPGVWIGHVGQEAALAAAVAHLGDVTLDGSDAALVAAVAWLRAIPLGAVRAMLRRHDASIMDGWQRRTAFNAPPSAS